MEQRALGRSGFTVPALSFGAGTFGGTGPLFSSWGSAGVEEARSMVDLCLERGVDLFDTADVYSDGRSEEVLGAALVGRRDRARISTKLGLPVGDGPADRGVSRGRLVQGVERALGRLQTDHIDLLQLHAYDASTSSDEVLHTVERLIRDGKVLHWGVSNYPGWALMELVERARSAGIPRPVVHQVYYSLIGRDYEWDLMPLGERAAVGALVWSPLGWGRLTGKLRRDRPVPPGRLAATAKFGPPVDQERLFDVVDVLVEVAEELGASVPQVALAWLLRRPTVSSVIVGARNATQLRDNLAAAQLHLPEELDRRLTRVSSTEAPYPAFPYRRQEGFASLFPPMVTSG